jgi:hypothetical protein
MTAHLGGKSLIIKNCSVSFNMLINVAHKL